MYFAVVALIDPRLVPGQKLVPLSRRLEVLAETAVVMGSTGEVSTVELVAGPLVEGFDALADYESAVGCVSVDRS